MKRHPSTSETAPSPEEHRLCYNTTPCQLIDFKKWIAYLLFLELRPPHIGKMS